VSIQKWLMEAKIGSRSRRAKNSNAGIHENRTFSICLPSAEDPMAETDYCGIMTGKNMKFWRLGPDIGKCWNVGKSLKK
jgi:hypothetical protein